MKTELLDMLDKIDGLIVEGFGAEIYHKKTQKLRQLTNSGLPIALVSRCFNGITNSYAYEGGGVMLREAGIMFVVKIKCS